jgi:release factor glutamine methyltransferase
MPKPTAAIVVATELIPAAAELARRNIARHGLSDHIEVRVGSLYEPLREEELGSFDLLVSNPPYVSDAAWAECDANVRLHEPETALRGGVDGLDVTRPLVAGAGDWLRKAGLLVIEIQHDQAEPVVRLFEAAGFGSTEVHLDFEGHARVVSGRATSR